MTVNAAVALLFPLLGSVAALLMVALLLTTLPFGTLGSTLATTVMVAERALAIEPIVQVSGCSGFPGMPQVHDPTLGVTANTLTSAGRVSFMRGVYRVESAGWLPLRPTPPPSPSKP